MPTILVLSNARTEQDSAVTLAETVEPEHLARDHHAAQLIERVGWALTDAKDAEDASDPLPESTEGAGPRRSAAGGGRGLREAVRKASPLGGYRPPRFALRNSRLSSKAPAAYSGSPAASRASVFV